MAYSSSRAIVIRTVKYGDNRLIVDFLTRSEGRLSVAVKASSRGKTGVVRQLFQPLNILDIEYSRTPRNDMARLVEAHIGETYCSLPFEGVKMSLAFFVAELLNYATRDLHADSRLYDFVERSLLWLDMAEGSVSNFHLMLMVHLMPFLGFQPDTEGYSDGNLFDMREGAFCHTVPLHGDYLAPDEARKMLSLMRMSAHNMHLFRMTRDERNRATDLMLRFYGIHLPSFGEMKSLPVLRSL